jgi:glycosyltransferase involved in cell wall biosynthesis
LTQPLRILHLRPSNFVGGPEKQILRHADRERNGPFEIALGTFVNEIKGQQFLAAIEKHGLPSVALLDRVLGLDNGFSQLVQVLKEKRISLLCTHAYKADALGILAARLVGIPVACFLRGWTAESWKIRGYEALDRVVLPLASRVVCLSETQAKRLSGCRFPRRKVRVVPNAVDVRDLSSQQRLVLRQRISRQFDLPPDALLVVTAGRLSPEKGTCFFLQAIPEILSQQTSAFFIVFGEGALRGRLTDLAQRLGIASRVQFAGFTPDFQELLPGFNALVNPSLSEEMPNVVLEAMASGVPVVATDVGGVREISGHENALEVITAGQPKAIASAVARLFSEPGRASMLAKRARYRVERAFSFLRQSQCFQALYRELLPTDDAGGVREELTDAHNSLVSRFNA